MNREIFEIGQLITSAAFLMAVRREVGSVKKDGFVVTDGRHHPSAKDYDVVVKCGDDGKGVARRIRDNVPGARVERIAEGILGVNASRRGRNG